MNRPNGRTPHAPPQIHNVHPQQQPVAIHGPHDQHAANQAFAPGAGQSAHQGLLPSHPDSRHAQERAHQTQIGGSHLANRGPPAPGPAVTRGFHPMTQQHQQHNEPTTVQGAKMPMKQADPQGKPNGVDPRKAGNRANVPAVTSPTGPLSPERVLSPTSPRTSVPPANVSSQIGANTRAAATVAPATGLGSQRPAVQERVPMRASVPQPDRSLTSPPGSPPLLRHKQTADQKQQPHTRLRPSGQTASVSGPVQRGIHAAHLPVKTAPRAAHPAPPTSPPAHRANARLEVPKVASSTSFSPVAGPLPLHLGPPHVTSTNAPPQKTAHIRFFEENGLNALTPRFYVSSWEYFSSVVDEALLPSAIHYMLRDRTRDYICIAWRDHSDYLWPLEIMYRDKATGITRIDHLVLSADGAELPQMREHMGSVEVGVTKEHTFRHDEQGLVLVQGEEPRPLRGDIFKPLIGESPFMQARIKAEL